MATSSIQQRLSRRLAWLTLLGLLAVCAVIYVTTAWQTHIRQEEEIESRIELAVHLINEMQGTTLPVFQHKLGDFFRQGDLWAIRVSSPSGLIFEVVPGHSSFWVWREQQTGEFSISVGMNVNRDASMLRVLAATLLLCASGGALIAASIGALLVKEALRPITSLAKELESLSLHKGQPLRDPTAFDKELGPWIAQFNELLTRTRASYEQLEAFNANVAHELRTPLANLIASNELALMRSRGDPDFELVLGSNLEELQRISHIVSDMLFLARADRGEELRTKESIELVAQIYAVVDYFEPLLEEKNQRTKVEGEQPSLIADAALFRRALSNLLSNASRHAYSSSEILINVSCTKTEVSVVVRNEGETIPPTALQHLFDRFYRVDEARDGSFSRHGLGLAIVKAIAVMHGGKTFAASHNGITEVGFTLAK